MSQMIQIRDYRLRNLFYPKSVAIIGASEKKGSLGRAIMENLLKIGFPGKIYPVNIRGNSCFGLMVYKSVLEIKDSVDLAVIVVPAKVVPRVVEECGKKGIKSVIVISAGFSETGEEGKKLEKNLLRIIKKYEIRILGPNCLGVYNPKGRIDLIFNPPDRQDKPRAGDIALLSQSGAFGATFLDFMAEEDIGISSFVSYGNAMDITESDLLEYFAEDPDTNVIAMYIEGVKNGRIFASSAEKVIPKKPIIVLKTGRTASGARAASSHTGSLAGSDQIYSAVFKQYGILRAETINELFVKAKALAFLNPARGNRIGIVTNGGGAGVLTSDFVELKNLKVAGLEEETIKRLETVLPPQATTHNPVDILGDAPSKRYVDATESVLNDKNVDGLIIIIVPQSPALEYKELVRGLVHIINAQDKPVVIAIPGGRVAKKLAREFERYRIPAYRTPEDAVLAMTALVEYGKILRKYKKKASSALIQKIIVKE